MMPSRIIYTVVFLLTFAGEPVAQFGTGTGPLYGGETAISGKYPWMVSVRENATIDGELREIHYCGAVVIGPRTVLTAAHCISTDVRDGISGAEVKIRVSLGAIDHNVGTSFTIPADQVFIPKQYKDPNIARFYDLAILILDRFIDAPPLPINDDPWFIHDVTLSQATDRADSAVMIGWGLESDPNAVLGAKLLQFTEMPVVSNSHCEALTGYEITDSRWICVAQNNSSTGGCRGDSGGPLIAYENGRPYLIGITSFIVGIPLKDKDGSDICARETTVFENMWYFADYITAIARAQNRYVHLKSDTFTVGYPNEVVALPLISNHVSSRHVFARNSGLGLNHYWWTENTDWNTQYFSDQFGISSLNLSAPAAVNGPGWGNNNVPTQHVFVRNLANGNLHHFYWVNYGGWNRENLSLRLGGLSMTESGPVVINGPEVGNRNIPSQHVFGITRIGFNRLVHFSWINHRGWQGEIVTNDTVNAGPYEPTGLPAPLIVSDHLRLKKNLSLYVRSQEGDLIQLHKSVAGGWRARNLTRLIVEQKIASNQCTRAEYDICINQLKISGDPVAKLGPRSGSGGGATIHIFAAGPSGNLMHFYWIPSSNWAAEDLTAKTNSGADGHIQGRPFVIVGPSRGNREIPSQHVFARNQAGELIQYFWVNHLGWQFGNLTDQTDGETITSDPVAIIGNQFGNSGVADLHVVAPASGARLVHYHWLNFRGWRYLGAASNSLTGIAYEKASALRGPVIANSGPNFAVYGKANQADHPRQYEMRGCCTWRPRSIGP